MDNESKSQDQENVEHSKASEPIFRPVSLERLSNPEQLDNLLVIVTAKSWIALIGLLILCLFAVLWAFFGSIPIKIDGKGIVMNEKGQLFNIQTKIGGTVQKIFIKPGDYVSEGDLVAEIYDAEEELKLKKAEIRVANLKKNYERLKNEIEVESTAQKEAQERELAAKEYSLQQTEKRIEDLEKEVERRQKLYEQGLVSHNVMIETEEKLANTRIELELTKAAIATLHYNLAKGYRIEELKSKEQELFKASEDLDLLRTREPYFQVFSPYSGNVLALLFSEGDIVQSGSPLIWMEYRTTETVPYVVYGFFPVEKGKRLEIGMTIQIGLSTIDSQEYGYLVGRVKEVSSYAVSKDSIAKIIHNRELVEYLSQGSAAVIQVIIDLEIDPATQQYRWTSGKVPPIKISTGTVCTLQGITHRLRPIYYILPIDSFKIESANP